MTDGASKFELVVDDREIKSGIIDFLNQSQNFNISIARMPIADYCIDGNLWIERKTISDLLTSIADGRLFEQCQKMRFLRANGPGHICIILEGCYGDIKNTAFNWNAVQGALSTVCLFWGIPLLRSHNLSETADLFLILARQNQNLHIPRSYKSIAHGKYKTKKQSQLSLLCSFPGLGPQKAQQLLKHFGSIEKIINASEEELQEVTGIGESIAGKIHHLVKENSGTYIVLNINGE